MVAIGLAWSLLVAGCSSNPSPSSGTAAAPVLYCSDGIPAADCLPIEHVVLAAVAVPGRVPVQVWLDTGQFCPNVTCLFDPNANFPYPSPPDGGTWLANAEIAFAATDEHAGLQVALVGVNFVPVIIGYRVPLPGWCSGFCPSSVVTDGPFRLELVFSQLAWRTDEAISGDAILSYSGASPTTVYGSSDGVIAFTFAEVGGSMRSGYAITADCVSRPLDPATPINVALFKSGALTGAEPDPAAQQAFLDDPQIHLPAGTWDVTAVAVFAEAAGCSAGTHMIKATERITVTG